MLPPPSSSFKMVKKHKNIQMMKPNAREMGLPPFIRIIATLSDKLTKKAENPDEENAK
jgi:hypothetical protein